MTTSDPFANLTPSIHAAVEGLTSLGYLTDTVHFAGHKFGIRTLYGNEELQVGLLTKEYVETLSQTKAWVWAHVCLAVTSIDGKTDFCPPIGPDEDEWAKARFNYFTKSWFYPIAEFVFHEYLELQKTQSEAIKAVQDLSTRSLRQSLPSRDSLTGPGDSTPETPSADLS